MKTLAVAPAVRTTSRFATLALPGSRTLADISVELAHSRVDRERALELHRDVYWRKGLLPENTGKPQVLPRAYAPGSTIFIAKEHDVLVGTIAFYMDSGAGLPIDDVHREEVDCMRRRYGRVGEAGGLAIREDRRGLGITMMLYQATLRWAVAAQSRCIVACVNPSSRRVYSRLLPFEVLGECKQHPRYLGAPSIPIGLDLTTAADRYREANAGERDRRLHTFFCET